MKYIQGEDLKFSLSLYKEGKQIKANTMPLDVKIWTIYPSQQCNASCDGDKYINCIIKENDLIIGIDKPDMASGNVNIEVTLHKPDEDMPDKVRDKILYVNFGASVVSDDLFITGKAI